VPWQVAEKDERRLAVGRQAAEPEGPLRLQVREHKGKVLHILPANKNTNCKVQMCSGTTGGLGYLEVVWIVHANFLPYAAGKSPPALSIPIDSIAPRNAKDVIGYPGKALSGTVALNEKATVLGSIPASLDTVNLRGGR
jgi:hypothetical protein